MGSWLGVMVNQIRPLQYDDQATETISFCCFGVQSQFNPTFQDLMRKRNCDWNIRRLEWWGWHLWSPSASCQSVSDEHATLMLDWPEASCQIVWGSPMMMFVGMSWVSDRLRHKMKVEPQNAVQSKLSLISKDGRLSLLFSYMMIGYLC